MLTCHRWSLGSSCLHGFFEGPKCFHLGTSCFEKFFSFVFRGPKSFSHRSFVGPKLFLVGISWVKNFFSWLFRGSKFFLLGILRVQLFFCRWIIWNKFLHFFFKFKLIFFLLVSTSARHRLLPFNKVFTTLKWVCRQIGNNYSYV